MKSKLFFLVLVILAIAIFLTSCQESTLPDPEEPNVSGLFLKFSPESEMSSYYVDEEGTVSTYFFPRHERYIPNSLLFEVNFGTARIVNSYLKIEKFFISSDGQEASFLIEAPVPIQSITAFKLPFNVTDFGVQSDTGNTRFNGLLKTDYLVLAIKDCDVLIYDIETKSLSKSKGAFEEGNFIFKINSQKCTLEFLQKSPIGNFFKFYIGDKSSDCCTLMS